MEKPWVSAKLLPLTWRDTGNGEYHASKGYPGVGAIVGKVWKRDDGTYRFDCSAWEGHGKQNANGDMPTLEDAKAMVEIVTQGPRPSHVQPLFELARTMLNHLKYYQKYTEMPDEIEEITAATIYKAERMVGQ